MLLVALSLRMCCSLVCKASLYAGLPPASRVTPTTRPGIVRRKLLRQAKKPACGPPYLERDEKHILDYFLDPISYMERVSASISLCVSSFLVFVCVSSLFVFYCPIIDLCCQWTDQAKIIFLLLSVSIFKVAHANKVIAENYKNVKKKKKKYQKL